MMELLATDATFWLLISFVIFCVICWKMGKDAVLNILDSRIDAIRQEIETAESLRVEAQELLAQYQRKQRDAEKEATGIIETAEAHAKEIKKKAEADLKETMERREAQLKSRLERMEHSAIAEIQKYAADLAIKATTEIIAEHLDKKSNEKLVSDAIKDVGKHIH